MAGNFTINQDEIRKFRSGSTGLGSLLCNTNSNMNIKALNPDITCHVFSFLDTLSKQSVALVCSQWRDIVYLPFLWKNVTVELKPGNVNETLIRSLATRRITRVSCRRCSSEDITLVFTLLPNITYLNVGAFQRVNQYKINNCRLHSIQELVFNRYNLPPTLIH